ncbi:hypothetical protein PHMEG_00015025 [Phytophthora megakarya]|uniref:Uncharacterized protein n=1 Tax=Phytophthora megakarya TaxID=4795 RepID=A0A225W3D9_9STRA|nr:hypothetical protein PHMEG_00015025 [Phytophthora megakarya]
MVTPRSENRKPRVAREAEQTESTANTRPGTGRSSSRRQAAADDSSSDEGSPFYQEDDENDVTTELDPGNYRDRRDGPYSKITPIRRKLDESENSMQWLRGFVYEMKGTHTPPNGWCMTFQTESQRCRTLAQSSISKNEAHLAFAECQAHQLLPLAVQSISEHSRSEKEHIRDYLNRLNGYARSANIKFERSGREAKEYAKHFLETCGDRDLERQLTHMRLRDIHTLEDIVSDIQKVKKRVPNRSPSQNVTISVIPYNSQVDLVKVDFDLQLNRARGSMITVVDAVSRDQAMVHAPHVVDRIIPRIIVSDDAVRAFDELAKILRTNVDKKNISLELQKLGFGGHLN